MAYRCCESGITPTYEPLPRQKKGPDLLLDLGKERFFCEVRRISVTDEAKEWDTLIESVRKQVTKSLTYDIHFFVRESYHNHRLRSHAESPLDILTCRKDDLVEWVGGISSEVVTVPTRADVTCLPDGFSCADIKRPTPGCDPTFTADALYRQILKALGS